MQLVLSLHPGGTERLVIELAKRASERFTVSVCCLDDEGAWAPELKSVGIDVFALGRAPGFRPGLALRIGRELRRRQVRVLHCHHYSSLVYGGLARVVHPTTRVVFTEHGRLSDEAPSRKRRLVTPLIAPLATELYAVSSDLRSYLLTAGFPRRMRVIVNGIAVGEPPGGADRLRARRLLNVKGETAVIAAVGRLDPVKDLGTLLAAFAALEDLSAILVLIGDGPEAGTLQAAARELGVVDRVRFLGHRSDVRQLLPGIDVFASSSVSEGISLTLLEAMAACLPVVATAVGGTPEVVIDGETGTLVPARNSDALTSALSRLLGVRSTTAMGAAGRARVEQVFTFDRMAERYLGAYASMALESDVEHCK